MISRSNIENIRKSVKQEGYTPTAQQIRESILKVCPDELNIIQYKTAIVQEVIKMQGVGIIPSDTEENSAIISTTEIQDSDTYLVETDTTQVEEIDTIEPESSLVISEQEKQALVHQQAQDMGIELSQSEVIQIAETVEMNSNTITEYIQEVEPAIKAFIRFRELEDSRNIDDFVTNIRNEALQSNQRIQSRLDEGLQNIETDLGGVRASWKRAKKLTLERFKVPAIKG